MRVLLLALLAVAAFASNMENDFVEFQARFNKVYASDLEFSLRYAVFQQNAQIANELSALNPEASFSAAHSPFGDLTEQEFRKYYLLPEPLDVSTLPEAPVYQPEEGVGATPAASFDWRSKDVITPVYNQGQCGSCWAFSATETVESYWVLSGKPMVKLSMQQIVDCDNTAYGCGGGWTYAAYKYLIGAGGQDTLASYPYTAENGQCQFNSANIGAKISSFKYVTQDQDETVMVDFLYNNGPLSICVDASSWQFYNGGVITSCGDQIDHCVQATGYGTQGGTPVWNVRNSWGTSWGNEGYLFVERGQDMCAIAQVVTAVDI